jgi:hypothetical protein
MTSALPDDIGQHPLARAVLAKLAATNRHDEPLGSLARTVLNGEVDLRTAVAHPWHGQALDSAMTSALDARRNLSSQERDDIERAAQRLRDAGAGAGADEADIDLAGPDDPGRGQGDGR